TATSHAGGCERPLDGERGEGDPCPRPRPDRQGGSDLGGGVDRGRQRGRRIRHPASRRSAGDGGRLRPAMIILDTNVLSELMRGESEGDPRVFRWVRELT